MKAIRVNLRITASIPFYSHKKKRIVLCIKRDILRCVSILICVNKFNPKEVGWGGGPNGPQHLIIIGSATRCPIYLKPSFIFKFVRLEVYKKIDQFGPWRDPGGPKIGKGPSISASQGQF